MYYIHGLLLFVFFSMPTTFAKQLLLIDCGGNSVYVFNSFLKYAQEAGFSTHFNQLYSCDVTKISSYDAIFVALDNLVIVSGLRKILSNQPQTPVDKKFLELLKELSIVRGKTIGLIFPSTGAYNAGLVKACQSLGNYVCGISTIDKEAWNEVQAFIEIIMQSDASLRTLYETTMLPPNEKKCAYDKKHRWEGIVSPVLTLGALPFIHRSMQVSCPSFALYAKNNEKNNHYLFTKKPFLTFNDIEENFFFTPMDRPHREHFNQNLKLLLAQLYQACKEAQLTKKILLESLKDFSLESCITVDKMRAGKKIICGWADPESYKGKEERVAHHLAAMNMDILWTEWNPEWYLSDYAIRSDQKETFFHTIRSLTKALAYERNLGKAIPSLYLGTDITSNFSKASVVNPVYDIFGNIYSKIPSPLDFKYFWKPELLDVFDKMHSAWENDIGNGVPLEGLFLDLEMYHAQDQTGQYTPLMDFSPLAWRCFIKSKPEASHVSPDACVHDRVSFLMQHNYFDDYFYILRAKAERIGQKIKHHLRSRMPTLKFAAYNMHLPHSWFYQGLLAGLSSHDEPVIMATFNTQHECHKPWLESRNIYLKHLPVILLSKLQKKRDFSLIPMLAGSNDGIWLNRISRLEESRNPAEWQWNYNLEVTNLTTEEFIQELNKKIDLLHLKK